MDNVWVNLACVAACMAGYGCAHLFMKWQVRKYFKCPSPSNGESAQSVENNASAQNGASSESGGMS